MANDLLKKIEAFKADTNLSDHRVGMLLANNGRLLPRLRAGGRVWPETVSEIEASLARETSLRMEIGASQ